MGYLLGALLEGTNIRVSHPETVIQGIASDSRRVVRGGLFICHRGLHVDGNDFIEDAVRRGAVCVITDSDTEPESPAPDTDCEIIRLCGITSREVESIVWNNYYHRPTDGMTKIAVTGTAGKTSTVFILRHILRSAGYHAGVITTVVSLADDDEIDMGASGGSSVSDAAGAMTTPDPEYFFGAAAVMRERGCDAIIFEASSQALDMHRIDAVKPDIAVFTNLSPEHLDHHGDMESYFAAKARLAGMAHCSIVNLDDSYMARLPKLYPDKAFITCSADHAKIAEADVCAIRYVSHGSDGIEYVYFSDSAVFRMRTPLLGRHSMYNTMQAAACASYMGVDPVSIKDALSGMNGIGGRLYKVRIPDREKFGFDVFIDYAHTPDSLRTVLITLREVTERRLILLFGCGGDRDRLKRPVMGRTASQLSDYMIITNDNPRTEAPERIIDDILDGVDKTKPYIVIPDRRRAIEYAVNLASVGDLVLLAGKGHEKYEITADGKHPFDEEKIVRELLSDRSKE